MADCGSREGDNLQFGRISHYTFCGEWSYNFTRLAKFCPPALYDGRDLLSSAVTKFTQVKPYISQSFVYHQTIHLSSISNNEHEPTYP